MAPTATAPDPEAIERIISLIDLTDLDDDHRPDGIEELTEQARRHATAAVCVWPEYVTRCRDALAGSGVRIATVVNFPSGASDTATVLDEVRSSLRDGADDVDVVLPYRRFLDGDIDHARSVLVGAAEVVHQQSGAQLKVILETGELASTDAISGAARLAIDCGADFVKTSTGKTPVSATPVAVAAILDVIAQHGATVGIKPSGGIKTVADAAAYLDLVAARLGPDWATPNTFRFGASGLLGVAVAALADD